VEAKVAVELQIREQTIYTWRRQARIDAGIEAGLTTCEKAELRTQRTALGGRQCPI
jgi:transposase-like protein